MATDETFIEQGQSNFIYSSFLLVHCFLLFLYTYIHWENILSLAYLVSRLRPHIIPYYFIWWFTGTAVEDHKFYNVPDDNVFIVSLLFYVYISIYFQSSVRGMALVGLWHYWGITLLVVHNVHGAVPLIWIGTYLDDLCYRHLYWSRSLQTIRTGQCLKPNTTSIAHSAGYDVWYPGQ